MNLRHGICNLLVIGMVLGIHNGYIALLNGSSDLPEQVYPYKASLLPAEEQFKLSRGIPIESEEHLTSLLKDYLS